MGTGDAASTGRAIRQEVTSRYDRGIVLSEDGEDVGVFPHSLPMAEYQALVNLAIAERAHETIEVGLCLAFSALAFLEATSDSKPTGRHIAMDPFQRSVWKNAGLRVVRELGLSDRFDFYEEESQLVLPALVREGREFDVAFVDGDHRFESAFLDIYYCARLVRPRGLVVVDDANMPAVALAIEYFSTNMACEVAPCPGTSGRMVTVRTPIAPTREWNGFVPFGASAPPSGRDALRELGAAVNRRARGALPGGRAQRER